MIDKNIIAEEYKKGKKNLKDEVEKIVEVSMIGYTFILKSCQG